MAVLALLRDHLVPRLIGLDAARVEAVWRDLYASTRATAVGAITSLALDAVDTALWDLRAKAAGLPCGCWPAEPGTHPALRHRGRLAAVQHRGAGRRGEGVPGGRLAGRQAEGGQAAGGNPVRDRRRRRPRSRSNRPRARHRLGPGRDRGQESRVTTRFPRVIHSSEEGA
ncbi:hypothetical protein [Micromonospora rhizosphaerae]|uniref:hypothetical protein n=1 Tax=Micromonospora rhizosphaerae TaxID=568872 RepID=UPI001C403244